ncbi:MAG: Ig-like domain-containing protein [bacterium]|nr:Ig-like domain-containing protein [bacterium]
MKSLRKHVWTAGGPVFATAVLLLSIGLMGSGCGNDKSNTASDTTAPMVTFVNPADLATDVPINRKIAALFSEEMDPLTLSTTTFTITQGTTPVSGAVTYAGTAATFTPASDLAASTVYTATISIGATDLAGNALASAYVWSFTTGTTPDTTPPTVVIVTPADLATNVQINSKIVATFNEAIDPLTFTAAFTVKQGTTLVPGTITYAGTAATFTPAANLAASTVYTATISTGAKDLAGNALASAYVWSFTTGTIPDTTLPTVVIVAPVNLATNVPINKKIAATFTEAMDPLTLTSATFTIKQGTTPVSGTVTYAGTIATFTPAGNLAAGTLYTATISTGAKDLAGNALASAYVWSFTTGTTPDTTPPTVAIVDPANLAPDVPINTKIAATFSEAMDPLTLTAALTVKQGTTPVSGTVTYAGTIATFSPAGNLAAGTLYTATIATGAKDLAGNALASAYVWSFTTGTSTHLGPAPVLLGQAGNFVILSKSGIDTIPTSAITGNIGVSPIDSTGITGFSLIADSSNVFSKSTQVTGQVFAADYAVPTPDNMTTAISNMETAFTDAAGRPTPDFTELGAGNISGLTLVPGLYKWGTGVLISSDVTIKGSPTDVWIFQIAGGITQASATKVILSGGALAKNIFWQAYGAVALDTTAHLEGVVLSQTEITLATGASVNGRLLAQTAVTLDASTVTQPAP